MTVHLRDYQLDLINQIQATLPIARHTMLQLHTGAGKTILAASFIQQWQGKVVVVVHRRELVTQWNDALAAVGAKADVITIQQLTVRKERLQNFAASFGPTDLLVIDECHHYIDNQWGEIIHEWAGYILGLTATPYRLEKFRGFERDMSGARVWNKLIQGPSRKQLIESGALVRAQVKAPIFGEIDGVGGTENSDFSVSAMMARFAENQLVQAAMTEYSIKWLMDEDGKNRKTIVFAVNQIHAAALLKEARKHGLNAEIVIAETPTHEREIAFARFLAGDLDALVTVAVLTEGIDLPACDTALIVRPTKSLALYMQMVGRVVRAFPDKLFGRILDASGNYTRFGHVDNEFTWSLKPMKRDTRLPKICDSCYTVNSPDSDECEGCGLPLRGAGGNSKHGIRCMECGRVRPLTMSQCPACVLDPNNADLDPDDAPVMFQHRNLEWKQDAESDNGLTYIADLPHLESKASIVQHGTQWTGQLIADDSSYIEMLADVDVHQRIAISRNKFQTVQATGYATVNVLTDRIQALTRLT